LGALSGVPSSGSAPLYWKNGKQRMNSSGRTTPKIAAITVKKFIGGGVPISNGIRTLRSSA
jgi:hypothetical protein